MNFDTILNYVIPTVITPFLTELIKTKWKISIPFISYAAVVLVSMAGAYGLSLWLRPDLPLVDILTMAAVAALGSVGLKAVDKSLVNSIIKSFFKPNRYSRHSKLG